MARVVWLEGREARTVAIDSLLKPDTAFAWVSARKALWWARTFAVDSSVVVGWVQDPAFEIVGIAPRSSGSIGPFRLLAPAMTRPLRGTITGTPRGGSELEAKFVLRLGRPIVLTGRTLQQEQWLRDRLGEILSGPA